IGWAISPSSRVDWPRPNRCQSRAGRVHEFARDGPGSSRLTSWGALEKGNAMSTRRPDPESARFAALGSTQTEVLTLALERALLREMADCRGKLARAPEDVQGIDVPRAGDDPQALAQFVAHTCSRGGPSQACLGAVHRRYCEIRTRLALANMKLV